jgi:serpin B
MLEKGARGESKAAIRRVLALSDEGTDNSSHVLAELERDLHAQASIEFLIANALWANVASPISPEYAKLCAELYDAEAHAIDFTQSSAAIAINAWIRKKTKGSIPQIVTASDISNALALITSAVYFKGTFRCPFWKELTEPQPFHLANGADKIVPMMRRGRLSDVYWHGDKCEAAEFRYCDSQVVLVLVLRISNLFLRDRHSRRSLGFFFCGRLSLASPGQNVHSVIVVLVAIILK